MLTGDVCDGLGSSACCPAPIQQTRGMQTYKKAIVYPGPRLNLVLGPNGMCPPLARGVLYLEPGQAVIKLVLNSSGKHMLLLQAVVRVQ